jgi:predicted transcriptional regulator
MISKNKINSREETLLNYLWDKQIPMTSAEMLDELMDQGWKQITLLKTIQSLTEKGYLEVVGLEKSVKTYARRFVPAISKGEFYSQMIMEKGLDQTSIVDITAALIGADGKSKEGTEKIIGTLESIIRDLKSGAEDKN